MHFWKICLNTTVIINFFLFLNETVNDMVSSKVSIVFYDFIESLSIKNICTIGVAAWCEKQKSFFCLLSSHSPHSMLRA